MSARRLAGVLRVRTIQERRARGLLGLTRMRHRGAVEAEDRTWRQLDQRNESIKEDAELLSLVAQRALTTAGMLAAATQRRIVTDAAAEVETAVDAWTIAARRVEALDRLADRIAALEADERRRVDAREIDDLVLAKFATQLEMNR